MCVHKSFGEPPNKPHDWPPFVIKNNRQTDDFDTTHQQKEETNANIVPHEYVKFLNVLRTTTSTTSSTLFTWK